MSQRQVRVLLVDDEQDIIHVLKKGLQLKGFKVDGFTDPQQAAEQFQPDSYDAVVTDIRMPEMDGFELYRKIREKDASIKVYFLSAFDAYEVEVKTRFPDAALTGFIRKPVSYSVLAGLLMKDFQK